MISHGLSTELQYLKALLKYFILVAIVFFLHVFFVQTN
jgi:hypothetical protein